MVSIEESWKSCLKVDVISAAVNTGRYIDASRVLYEWVQGFNQNDDEEAAAEKKLREK